MSFNSQFGEDRYIVENLKIPEKGIFVDVGAGNPIRYSNTYHFEQKGWRGLCVDPDPRQYRELRDRRGCYVVHGAVGTKKKQMKLAKDPDISGSAEHVQGEPYDVEWFTLGKLLRIYDFPRIDVLSIDTEGTEIDVWESFNEKVKPVRVLVVEYNTVGMASNEQKYLTYFTNSGFTLKHKTKSNYIFLNERF